ncbi:hypothetical protein MCEMRE249_00982 [Candidatus Nanopelagicaceae bacterium]
MKSIDSPEEILNVKNGSKSSANFLGKIIISIYFLSVSYSQWYFAGIEEGTLKSIVPKNLTSILVISLLFFLFNFIDRIMNLHKREKVKMDSLSIACIAFLFSTFCSIAVGVWKSGLNFDSLEGIKSMAASLCGLCLVRYFSQDLIFYLRVYSYIFGTVVLFSVFQFASGVDWQTENSFFTVGAQSRWWDLYSAWGPFALSGKNVFGVVLVISFSLLCPVLLFTSYFSTLDRILTSGFLLITCYLILASRSRTSIILLSANVIIILLFYSTVKKNWIPLLLLGISSPLLMSLFLSRNTSWVLNLQSSVARSNSLSAAVLAPESNYFFGTGYNSIFKLTASTFGNSLSQAGDSGINVDNYFLRRLLEGGLLGLLSFLGVIFVLGTLTVRRNSLPLRAQTWSTVSLLLFIDIIFASATGDFLSFQIVNCYFFVVIAFVSGGLRGARK